MAGCWVSQITVWRLLACSGLGRPLPTLHFGCRPRVAGGHGWAGRHGTSLALLAALLVSSVCWLWWARRWSGCEVRRGRGWAGVEAAWCCRHDGRTRTGAAQSPVPRPPRLLPCHHRPPTYLGSHQPSTTSWGPCRNDATLTTAAEECLSNNLCNMHLSNYVPDSVLSQLNQSTSMPRTKCTKLSVFSVKKICTRY